jgi:hypothetical protein
MLVMVIEPSATPVVVGANCAVNDVLCPAPKSNGVASPLMLNPAPLALPPEIVTLVLPVFVRVTVCGLELPTTTLLKAMLPGFAINVEFAATPLPTSVGVCGEFGAPSVKTMLPVTPPAVVGANCTLKDALWPAAIVAGRESPLILMPLPEIVAAVTVRLEFPLLVRVTVCVALCPTVTFPKLTEAGVIARPGCIPVPLNEIVRGELEASLMTERVPVAAAAEVGANRT